MKTINPSSPTQVQTKRASGRSRATTWLGRGAIALSIILAVLAAAGALYQAIATWADERAYPPPGQLVDVGGHHMHIYCTGNQIAESPTVILDASFPGTVSSWAWVQPEVARTTRVCSYDRAGLGWSEPGPEPRDAEQHANELHTLLRNAGIPGPYVLAGHSLGGLSVRLFAQRYPDEVAGIVLIEGSLPDAWKRLGLSEGVGVDRNQLALAPWLARLGIFRLGLIPMHSTDPDLPPRQQAELQAFFNTVKYLETAQAVDAAFSTALDQVREAGGLGSKPLGVVLGSQGDGGQELLRDLFAQQAAQSTNSYTLVIEGATHAGLVHHRGHAVRTAAIIVEVVEAARSGQPLGWTEDSRKPLLVFAYHGYLKG